MQGSSVYIGENFWDYVASHIKLQHIIVAMVSWLAGINQYIRIVPVATCYIFIAACFNLSFPEVLRSLTWERVQKVIKRIFLLTTPWILFHIGWIPINRLMWIAMHKYQPGIAETWMPLLSTVLSILCLVASVVKSIGFTGIYDFFDDMAHGTGRGIQITATDFFDMVRGIGRGGKLVATGIVVITRGSGRGVNKIVIGLYGLIRIIVVLGFGYLGMPVVTFYRVVRVPSLRPVKAPDPDVRTTRSGRVYGRWN